MPWSARINLSSIQLRVSLAWSLRLTYEVRTSKRCARVRGGREVLILRKVRSSSRIGYVCLRLSMPGKGMNGICIILDCPKGFCWCCIFVGNWDGYVWVKGFFSFVCASETGRTWQWGSWPGNLFRWYDITIASASPDLSLPLLQCLTMTIPRNILTFLRATPRTYRPALVGTAEFKYVFR